MALWPKYDEAECAAFRTLITARKLNYFHFQRIGGFTKLLDDRQLMAAFIHVGVCLNPACREMNGQVQRWLTCNAEIPVAIIGRMESWRTKVEGWPPAPKKEEG